MCIISLSFELSLYMCPSHKGDDYYRCLAQLTIWYALKRLLVISFPKLVNIQYNIVIEILQINFLTHREQSIVNKIRLFVIPADILIIKFIKKIIYIYIKKIISMVHSI